MCAYVGPQRRCLHLFISGQMLVAVEIERESGGGSHHSRSWLNWESRTRGDRWESEACFVQDLNSESFHEIVLLVSL